MQRKVYVKESYFDEITAKVADEMAATALKAARTTSCSKIAAQLAYARLHGELARVMREQKGLLRDAVVALLNEAGVFDEGVLADARAAGEDVSETEVVDRPSSL